MAEGINSNVSDDDSDAPSFEDLLDLIHEQQGVMKRQTNEIKNLNALNDLNSSLATNYKNLLCKFKLLSKEYEELKLKFESINDTNDSLEMKQTIPYAIPISRIDVGVPTRGPGSQLVNAAYFLVPDDDARGNTVTHGLSWFRPWGRTSSKMGCARACIILHPEGL